MVCVGKIFMPYCSCGEPLGMKQYKYEKMFDGVYKEFPSYKLNIIQAITIDRMGWKKVCCRQNVFNAPIRFVRDSLSESITLENKKSQVFYIPAHKFEEYKPFQLA